MINFISLESSGDGIAALASKIVENLNAGKKVLWLIAGGSNIPIAVKVMKEIRDGIERHVNEVEQRLNKSEPLSPRSILSISDNSERLLLENLTISQTDERYGPEGHADSNWRQLIEAGFNFIGIKTIPVLTGLSLEDTVKKWSKDIEQAFQANDIRIGQFGIGPDGHIAGILPNSPAAEPKSPAVIAYEAPPYTRITLTPTIIKRLTEAVTFAYGDSKKKALLDLRDRKLSVNEQPAQLLKSVPNSTVYTDVI